MADIFISYSKASRSLTENLAIELQAKGFSVWWDAGLVAGDSFSDVILEELEQARAAIVIWTNESVKSQWVRSEARRAQERRVLIPVRAEELNTNDIPLPFDGIHTGLVSNTDAIVAALAKLGILPPAKQVEEPDRFARLEAGAWARLPKKRTVGALQEFLADFPEGIYARAAEEELQHARSRILNWSSRIRYGGYLFAGLATLSLLLMVIDFVTPGPSWGWIKYFVLTVAVAVLYLGIALTRGWRWKRHLAGIVCTSTLGVFAILAVLKYQTTELPCDDPSLTEAKLRRYWNGSMASSWPAGVTYSLRELPLYHRCEIQFSDGVSTLFKPYNVLGFTWIRD
jgi:hypothetical protein